MAQKKLNSDSKMKFHEKEVYNEYTVIDGQEYSVIHNVDEMKPFFMSIVSSSDLWLFVSSNGGVSAGRVNADHAILPYETDDKIIDNTEVTGSKTIIKTAGTIWEPFSDRYVGIHKISRNLYKSTLGNTIIFEEINYDLELQFRYQWSVSDKYGLVKKSSVMSFKNEEIDLEILDGVQNILPPNVSKSMQLTKSNLVNAYKRNELVPGTAIGLITLSANIVDRAEPSEALLATTAWSKGLENAHTLLSSGQLSNFRKGNLIQPESDIKGERGAFFQVTSLSLKYLEEKNWHIVLDTNQDQIQVMELVEQYKEGDILSDVSNDIIYGEQQLKQIVGSSDGLQVSADKNSVVRHFANTTFNVMRGGIFVNNYQVDSSDFIQFVKDWNKAVYASNIERLEQLPAQIQYDQLKAICEASNDKDLNRICLEYMPLTFSRRHGDPSRPWNVYNIRLKNEDGSQLINYEGNWRDIFQNWETLGRSYPGFIQNMFTKFLNASTIDGYNPYRIDKKGVDWEREDPEDPWAFIGYWGDHQVIYLLKLLESFEQHFPGELAGLLNEKNYTFANVPYRIKSYNEILADPYNTIIFDNDLDRLIENRVKEMGYDGKLVIAKNGEILKVSLIEKLLVMLLTKLSNYIPDGGIWLNTQRPEWNDANNALVGYGISMVTLCYIQRFLKFFNNILGNGNAFQLSIEVSTFLEDINAAFEKYQPAVANGFDPKQRKAMVDELGIAGEKYRKSAYAGFTGQEKEVSNEGVSALIDHVELHIRQTIRHNKREDGLYHSYNLLDIGTDSIEINYLYEMLEGQVAVLSAGILDTQEAVALLDSLKSSALFREDQYSYLLYPNRELKGFLDKNIVPAQEVENNPLLQLMLSRKDHRIIGQDLKGQYHFNAQFTNVMDLKSMLQKLSSEKAYIDKLNADGGNIERLFEKTFNHKEFTGRSGTFFGYEGLGSIYWHMVSKLLLAVQENLLTAHEEKASTTDLGRLIDHYYEIRAGIGINKPASLYGAYPTDPYSHTPWHKGAQQPGMTGQVKEDILNRWGELGLVLKNGELHINPFFLSNGEYLNDATHFEYFDLSQKKRSIVADQDSLIFTYCQVPFIYAKGEAKSIKLYWDNGKTEQLSGGQIGRDITRHLFGRSGKIDRIEVTIV